MREVRRPSAVTPNSPESPIAFPAEGAATRDSPTWGMSAASWGPSSPLRNETNPCTVSPSRETDPCLVFKN